MTLTGDGRILGAAATRAGTSDRIAAGLTGLAVVAVMLLSGMVLIAFGIPYASAGGSAVTKIHPATWIAAVALVARIVAEGGPIRLAKRLTLDRPGLMVFALATLLLFFQTLVVVRLPLAAVIDNFLLPIFLFVGLDFVTARDRDRLGGLVHTIFIANSLLGLVEYTSGWRLTPMYDSTGVAMAYDWRSTALFGHPLTNAFQTGCYLIALASGAAPRLPPLARFGLMALTAAALVAFGGRVAMLLSLGAVGAIGAIAAARILLGGRFRLRSAAIGVFLICLVVVATVVFVDAGGADRFLLRFVQDDGSAATRVSMFRIFGDLTPEQFLLWPDADLMIQAQRQFDLKIGIESTEVAFVAFYGVVVSVLFFLGLAAFLRETVRIAGIRSVWLVLFFVGVMSASTGIANESTGLALFVITQMLVMPRAGPATPLGPRGADGSVEAVPR